MIKVAIHTDVFLEHLFHTEEKPSTLRLAMKKFFCYTTVFNAIELFSIAETPKEIQKIEDVMSAMKLLGLNAKNSKLYGMLLAENGTMQRFNLLIAGLCLESKLSIITSRPKEFRGVEHLHIIPASLLRKYETAEEILRASRRR
ncbi:MAG: type II toxin-antitoxin system VapC family toxin [Ignavibacteria bacterium]|nr:type II toxin-antitoxin system VapC family toxin [Ignavibacteria bacterium]